MAQHQTKTFTTSGKPSYCQYVGDDNSNSGQKAAQNDPGQTIQSKPRFARRSSMKEHSSKEGFYCDDQDCNGAFRRSAPEKEHAVADELFVNSPQPSEKGGKGRMPWCSSILMEKSVARICGPSRSKCGYCGGKRFHVLGVKDAYNNIVALDDVTKYEHGCEEEPALLEKKKIEDVGEMKTSKSYGLLFDCLPYGTFEDLINHGWRRSGKHLYRPHNFESCCPAISIRLNVLKFASRFSPQPSDAFASRVDRSDLARMILVRGSKSQRKVGKIMLRALEKYNSKCAPAHAVLSSDDSVHTSHVAKMQLNDSISDFARSGCRDKAKAATYPMKDELNCQPEPKHQHKKSRKLSPDRGLEKPDDITLSTNQHLAASPLSKHCAINQLQHMLKKISRNVYQTITNEAIKSVANYPGGIDDNGNQIEKPSWAWWDRDGTGEEVILPKWCSFKVSKSRRGVKDQRNVMVSTSACAAAGGRSRGGVDKNLLVCAVVASLRRFVTDSSQQNNEENEYRVSEVLSHEKSGHVHVMLVYASLSAGTAPVEISKHAIISKKNNHVSFRRRFSQSFDEMDPIAEFLARHEMTSQKINEPNLAQNKSSHHQHQHKNPHQQRILTVRSVPVHESSLQPEVHQLFCRYQTAVHGDFDPFFGTHKSSKGKDDDHDYTYYQQKSPPGFLDIDAAYCHLDETRRSKIKTSYLTFYRFLCETPVAQDEVLPIENLPSVDGFDFHIPFGTYHQQYRLSTSKEKFDGPLIAVGVADILPHCFSSVYAFYDPILSNSLELGKYTALREIEWVRRASHFRPKLQYYYLGYYIHSCRKMTYKAEYKPSELLCPVNMKWVDFDDGKKRLEECSPIRHCCALFTDSRSVEQSSNASKPGFKVEDITLDIGEKEAHLVQVGMLNRQGREFIDPHVNEFVSEVGINMCSKFVIKLR